MPRVCIITALPAETRPLLDALKLHQLNTPHLRVYGSDQYLLLESGMGKLNAAATTGALLSRFPDINAVLNIGIAGGCFDYASVVVANCVRDKATGTQWFPHLPAHASFRTTHSACVETVDAPARDYQQSIAFDMEAAGIFTAASRYLSTSQIHCVKVISDNPQHTIDNITKESVIQLVQQSLPVILPMLDALTQQTAMYCDKAVTEAEAIVQQTLDATRHSVNDEHQLRQLVLQYSALTGKPPTLTVNGGSAAKIRRELQASINAQAFIYSES